MKTRIDLVISAVLGITVTFASGIVLAGAIAGDRGTMLYTRTTTVLTVNDEGERVPAEVGYFGAGVI